MAQEIQGSLVLMYVSETPNNFKLITCEESSQASTTSSVTNTSTKCGSFAAVATPETVISGSGVANGDPAADQVSYKQIRNWVQNKTPIYFIYKNIAASSIGITNGEVVYLDGLGYFTEATVTAQDGDVVKFNWSFSPSGTIDDSPDS
jgi:hypothetical protein